MRRRLVVKLRAAPGRLQVLDARAEHMPLEDSSADAVVFTCVLCSVQDPDLALAEARRVLKPGGTLAVLEHVRGTDELARWQDRVTPLWARLMGGCHPNRDIEALIARAGFTTRDAHTFDPLPRWVPTRPLFRCVATR
jgi:ubiquinone/menaquinone biosynthesis C-methylase UbiE